ncbi:MAG: hypothetical protein AAFO95_10850 [Cyanobacteria bacterium J06600_6]
MPNSNLTMAGQLVTASIITLTLCPLSIRAATIEPDLLETPAIIARQRLISEGISAYQKGYYSSAVYLLRNFLNPHRLIKTPLEKSGINHLALAYQAIGESFQATATIERAISVTSNSPLELATSEYNAGLIASLQNEQEIANQHWEIARQLYKNQNRDLEWKKTTLQLVQSHRELGNLPKSRRLLEELKAIKP